MKIDFVVTWVDGSDPKWIKEKNKYSSNAATTNTGMNSIKAFREWDTFKYWFRGVEKFAPWVNKVYLVTYHQVPSWMNIDCKKLKIVDHYDFLDHSNLPVFSSHPIEINLHRIKNLSEHFVYFNDDMYLTSPVEPNDFFDANGLPKYTTALSPIFPERYGTGCFQINDMELVTSQFSKKEIMKNAHLFDPHQGIKNLIKTTIYCHSKHIPGFAENHLPYPMLKSTMEKVWKVEEEVLQKTSQSRFREKNNVNFWLFKYWLIACGKYSVGDSRLGKLFTLDDASPNLWKTVTSQKYKLMCINDGFNIDNRAKVKHDFIKSLATILPEKSSFEI